LLSRATAANFSREDDFIPEIPNDEILRKLDEAEEDFRMGRYMSLEELEEALGRHMNELRP